LTNPMEVKVQRNARAPIPQGRVRKKRGAKVRADEQKPDTRHTESGERAYDRQAHIHQGLGL
jgi:hypothetical protein